MLRSLAALLSVALLILGVVLGSPMAMASASTAGEVQILHPGEGERRYLGGIPVIFKTKVSGEAPDQVSITESPIQPGEGAPFHKHAAETFYVLEGQFEFYAGQPDGSVDTIQATAGDIINIPEGVPHAPKNVGQAVGRLLTITGSDWFQNFLLEASSPAASDASDFGVPSLDQLIPIGEKYGIEFVDPTQP